MTRKVEHLTCDHLAVLPGDCPTCLFWELDPVRRTRARGRELEAKAAWLHDVLEEWGPVGRVVKIDDAVVGHLIWAPARYLPGSAGFATAPVSPDAVVLACGHIAPAYRGQGLGRVLVQAMAADLIKRGGIGAVEAFGAKREQPGTCALPTGFLAEVGFRTQREHQTHPRMRMDLRTTLTWREELGTAAGRILGAVTRPVGHPAPVAEVRGGVSRASAPSGAR